MGEDRADGAVLDRVRAGRGPHRPRVEPVRAGATGAPRPPRSASRGSACGTPTSSISSRRTTLAEMAQDLRRRRARSTSRSSSSRTSSSTRASPARADSDALRKQLFETAAAFDAHHIKVGNIPGTPCELGQADRGVRRAVRRRREAHRRARSSTRSCRSTSTSTRSTPALELVHEARPSQRRPGDRHLAHGQARHPARGPQADPARVPGLGRAVRRPVREHGRPDRRGRQPPPAARRGRVRHPRLRRGVPGGRLRRARGGSRSSPRSCATCPIEEEFKRAYETTAAQFRAGVA